MILTREQLEEFCRCGMHGDFERCKAKRDALSRLVRSANGVAWGLGFRMGKTYATAAIMGAEDGDMPPSENPFLENPFLKGVGG